MYSITYLCFDATFLRLNKMPHYVHSILLCACLSFGIKLLRYGTFACTFDYRMLVDTFYQHKKLGPVILEIENVCNEMVSIGKSQMWIYIWRIFGDYYETFTFLSTSRSFSRKFQFLALHFMLQTFHQLTITIWIHSDTF